MEYIKGLVWTYGPEDDDDNNDDNCTFGVEF